MTKNIVLYYFLILLLVMGAFASMALNSYGTVLMSYVMLGFAGLFLFELFFILPREGEMTSLYKTSLGVELFVLSAICALYFMQGISHTFSLSSGLLFTLFTVLLAINCFHMIRAWKQVRNAPVKVRLSILLYFSALLLFIASNFLEASLFVICTVLGFVSIVFFAFYGWWKGRVIINGVENSAMRKVVQFRNKSGIQLIVLALAAAYALLNSIQVLPPLYVGSLPNGYSKVVQQWQEDRSNVKPKEFEEAYRKFLEGK
ncbi:MAG: hypothetical protein RIB47_05520 [Cyclobacteriaceae bacterium]